MKFEIFAASLLCAFALSSPAVLPTYKSLTTNGLAAGPAQLIFPSDPNSQIRIVNVAYQSDTNKGQLQFTTGVGAFNQTMTNAATTSVTNQINSTNGLVPGDLLVLEHGGVEYTNTISTFGVNTNNWSASYNGTNVVLNTGGWGVIPSPGDNVYQFSAPTNTYFVGAGTNLLSGEAIYVGNYGRPVLISLTPALVTNSLNNVSAHYDSQSN